MSGVEDIQGMSGVSISRSKLSRLDMGYNGVRLESGRYPTY